MFVVWDIGVRQFHTASLWTEDICVLNLDLDPVFVADGLNQI